jgi:hypothetical protein
MLDEVERKRREAAAAKAEADRRATTPRTPHAAGR